MNQFERIRESVENVQAAIPAARAAIQGARQRLEAPWYVRAWHQACGHEGWGRRGDELSELIVVSVLVVGFIGWLYWILSR